ncbi:Dabb family protein [Rhizobiaceae bacterium BDR2-2]|uniref:Dabb family protein n=1 Tax=Ectorhizobium quercum TaxID=2965071 RepID=A0AAE3SX07_9HYPH|nr:Dabb family protein [Ectorhizobium quercum]MCX8996387.1 Dabb family protein [Ectorhizobium quercum]MCX8998574.1 Dabb family protein [Ectorhizobium quercum]
MILHCVFLRLKAATTAEEKEALYRDVASLKSVIPGVASIKAGPNVSPEHLDGGFLDGFVVTFDTTDARDRYLAHPAHRAVSERIVQSLDGGLAGIIVYDIEM